MLGLLLEQLGTVGSDNVIVVGFSEIEDQPFSLLLSLSLSLSLSLCARHATVNTSESYARMGNVVVSQMFPKTHHFDM